LKKPVYKTFRFLIIIGGEMRTEEHKPHRHDSFAPGIASLTQKRTIFYDRPVLVGADNDGIIWKEVGIESKHSGKFVVGASGSNGDRVTFYGLVYANQNPSPEDMKLIEHGNILQLLMRLRKLTEPNILVLGGGSLSIVHEPLIGRAIEVGGICGEFGYVTKNMLKSALSMLERKSGAGDDKGYRLEIHANDTIVASDIAGSALKKDEVLDWYHSVHIPVG
jgi:hypothetical protein